MPSYKLLYFKSRGRAEVARLIMAFAGIQYEDVRIEQNNWPEVKPTIPFGQLPVLYVDDEAICQSNTIARFLAKKAGLMGKDDIEDAKIEMIADIAEDMITPLLVMIGEQDPKKKESIKKMYTDIILPDKLSRLESFLKPDEYFIGNKISLADIKLSADLTWPPLMDVPLDLSKYPKVKALSERVNANPKIAEWLAKRPQTPF